jgi:hypothetical protein
MRPSVLARTSLFALLALLPGCRSCLHAVGGSGTLDSTAVGPAGNVDDVDFAPYLAVARAIITHAPKPDVQPPTHTGQRVFVTFWAPGRPPLRATGLGPTLLDSVTRASDEIAKTASGDGRVEIDVLTGAEPADISAEIRESVFTAGTQGYLASDAAGHIGFVLPNEVVAEKLADFDDDKKKTVKMAASTIHSHIAERSGVAAPQVDAMSVARFSASERVEGARPGEPPLALYRSLPKRPTEVTADQLLAAVRSADDYLARMVGPDGGFLYQYDPTTDAPAEAPYSLLRHIGAIYAMMEGYDELHVASWVAAADRAIAFMLARVQKTPDGAFLSDNPDLELEKVGGAGLAIIALAQYQQATGDPRYLEAARAFARFIVHAQYLDGHYRDNSDVHHEDEMKRKKRRTEVFFYLGEAALGLLRLYALDPSPEWLASARKASDWVVDVRDAHTDLAHQIPDHWMSYALHDVYVLTGDKKYLDHAIKIAHAIELEGFKPPFPAPDYAGALSDAGDTTASAIRLEALASDIQLLRYANQDDAWVKNLATPLAAWMRGAQLDEESGYLARNPARAMGGVRESALSGDMRNDINQHALSGWLRLARELRDPSWGRK